MFTNFGKYAVYLGLVVYVSSDGFLFARTRKVIKPNANKEW